ncbi:LysR family transcriptional regulator [Ramlibacter sp. AN1133]|uniref:LysR family transcriptional regulator n=1 Tax=Ramlibacter sp. AN1133 TaxID=3133429 RepID=UPI0030C10407
MASLDLQWVAVFDEVYKSSSVSRAAERLGITQGAASTALNRLRAYYDDPLFTRTARGVLATPRADALHPVLREVREALELARRGAAAFEPARAERTFRIAMTDLGEISLLPRLLNHLRLHAPRIRVDADKITAESPRQLQDGAIDLTVGYLPQLEAGFYQQALFEQDFVCIASHSHPRIRKRLSRTLYTSEQHVVVTASGTGHAAMIEQVLEQQKISRRVALRVPSFLAVAQIVGETELIATVPRHYADVMVAREPIRQLPVPYPLPRYTVKQHWHVRYHRDAGNAWLRRTVAELMPAAVKKPPAAR